MLRRRITAGGLGLLLAAMVTPVTGGCADDCADDPPGPSVTLVLRNERGADVFVQRAGGCLAQLDFRLVRPSGGEVGTGAGACSTCEARAEGRVCSADCAITPSVHIPPGGEHRIVWRGVDYTMADHCGVGQCLRSATPESGSYELSVAVFATAEACGEQGCACDEVSCPLPFDAGPLSDPIAVTTTFDYPAQTQVEVVID